MRESLLSTLSPVRGRQQMRFALRCGAIGLLAAGVAGAALGVARIALGLELPLSASLGVLLAGPVAGLLVGIILRRTLHEAASAVDGHYGLKDRAVTALAFSGEQAPTELQSLQMTEAESHLAKVVPKAVVPMTMPRVGPAAIGGTVLAALLLFWPTGPREAEAGPEATPDYVVATVEGQKEKWAERRKELAESLNDVEDQKSEDDKKAMKELVEKKDKKLDEMASPTANEREVLAKLAEMSATNQAMLDQLNVAALDGQLGALGTALAASQAFEAAGKALMKGDLEKAAKEFEKLDEVKLTPKEAKDLDQKLREQQKKMADAGQGSLSDAVGELADGLNGSGKGGVGKAGKNIAKQINNAIRRKKAANLLNADEEDAKDAKSAMGENGGSRTKKKEKSDSPSSNWGRGISGNTEGDKTKLNGKRNEMQLTGTPGDKGDSDVETLTTPEARQQAGRDYKDKFAKGKKESDAVLESEPIPLGHRQTVKKYFELIRPSADDAFKKGEEKKAAEKK